MNVFAEKGQHYWHVMYNLKWISYEYSTFKCAYHFYGLTLFFCKHDKTHVDISQICILLVFIVLNAPFNQSLSHLFSIRCPDGPAAPNYGQWLCASNNKSIRNTSCSPPKSSGCASWRRRRCVAPRRLPRANGCAGCANASRRRSPSCGDCERCVAKWICRRRTMWRWVSRLSFY